MWTNSRPSYFKSQEVTWRKIPSDVKSQNDGDYLFETLITQHPLQCNPPSHSQDWPSVSSTTDLSNSASSEILLPLILLFFCAWFLVAIPASTTASHNSCMEIWKWPSKTTIFPFVQLVCFFMILLVAGTSRSKLFGPGCWLAVSQLSKPGIYGELSAKIEQK